MFPPMPWPHKATLVTYFWKSALYRVLSDRRNQKAILYTVTIGLLVLSVGSSSADAQANVYTNWSATFGNGMTIKNEANAIAGDAEGNAVVTGWICVDAACSDQEGFTVKFDSQGAVAWKDSLSSPVKVASGIAVKLDAAGNAYVLYELNLTNPPGQPQDLAIAKYNPAGVRQWIGYEYVRGTVLGNGGAALPFLAVSPGGNAYIAYEAQSASDPTTGTSFLIKYDTTGKRMWEQTQRAAGGSLEAPLGLGLDANENVYLYVFGTTQPPTLPKSINSIYPYDSDGNFLGLIGDNLLRGSAFYVDAAGATYVAADGGGTQATTVTKFNADHSKAWVSQPAMPPSDNVKGITTDEAGEVFVGQTIEDTPPTNGDSNISVAKLTSAGRLLWFTNYNDHAFGDLAQSETVSIATNRVGEAYVTGIDGKHGGEPPIGATTTVTIKYDSTEKQMWLQRISDPLSLSAAPSGLATAGGQLFVVGSGLQPPTTGAVASGSEWFVADYVQDALQLSSGQLSFGRVKVGTQSVPLTVQVRNTAETPLAVNFTFSGNSAFNFANDCASSIPPYGSCVVSVTFKPTVAGTSTGTISTSDNWTGNLGHPQGVNLIGTGTN